MHQGFFLDYYQRPFLLIHEEISRICPDITSPHPIRERFWQLIPNGEYTPEQGRVFLETYLTSIESELAKLISNYSVAYCIHLYRRLSPGPIGKDQQLLTIGLTRAVLEAAIQKYASFQLCGKIANSATTPIDKVLGGLLMSPEFESERNIISENNQLVLTDFSSSDLLAFYDLEKLAYEIWRTGAALRTTGKGAPLTVADSLECFGDNRSLELDFLVKNYDNRLGKSGWSYSASGVVFPDKDDISKGGLAFLPIYNLGKVTSKEFEEFFHKAYRVKLVGEITFNFFWLPFNLREYRKAHLPFSKAFHERYDISLDAALAVVAALSFRVFNSWYQTRGISFFRYYQRAYELCKVDFIRDEIIYYLPEACRILEIDKSSISYNEIQDAIKFWALDESNRNNIDLSYSGPHYIFIPIQNGQVLVDYAWIVRRLHDLFLGINIRDQNFKGKALENIVRKSKSALPTGPCKSFTGERRQIDYAFPLDDYLVIAECKAVSMSIGFDRGDPKAIKYRTDKVVERGLREVDEKARWLSRNPTGTNYDVSKYNYIVPLAISPFIEFIPSRHIYYWLSKEIPRVLTPVEFGKFISDTSNIVKSFNKVKLN